MPIILPRNTWNWNGIKTPIRISKINIQVGKNLGWINSIFNIKIKRNENYPIVRFSLFNKKDILPGVIIEKYNNIDLSKLSDNEIEKLHRLNKVVELKILKSQNKIKHMITLLLLRPSSSSI